MDSFAVISEEIGLLVSFLCMLRNWQATKRQMLQEISRLSTQPLEDILKGVRKKVVVKGCTEPNYFRGG